MAQTCWPEQTCKKKGKPAGPVNQFSCSEGNAFHELFGLIRLSMAELYLWKCVQICFMQLSPNLVWHTQLIFWARYQEGRCLSVEKARHLFDAPPDAAEVARPTGIRRSFSRGEDGRSNPWGSSLRSVNSSRSDGFVMAHLELELQPVMCHWRSLVSWMFELKWWSQNWQTWTMGVCNSLWHWWSSILNYQEFQLKNF